MAGTTNRMFIINATTPGGLTFSGAGTATFNNSVGTSNQFNVGSNTSIGVNANISATQEFDGASVGIMTLGTGSSLMQTNGPSRRCNPGRIRRSQHGRYRNRSA